MDGPGPRVAVVPARQPARLPREFSVTLGIDADDLRDWTGSSTLIEAYPKYEVGIYVTGNEGDQSGPQASQSRGQGAGTYVLGNEGDQPYAGWHWGNRGAVTSAAIEKPHRSGWRPLLECEFDLAYTPLMELDYGNGRLIVCTLDLEDHVVLDPAARRIAGRILDYAIHAPAVSPGEQGRLSRQRRRRSMAGQNRSELSAVGDTER